MQVALSDSAIGPSFRVPYSKKFVEPPSNDLERTLCASQRMRKRGGFVNISYFGLIFIVVISSVIIIVDLTLLQLLLLIRRLTSWRGQRLDRWVQDSILHLQRRAFEAQGENKWKRLDKEVPITQSNSKLEELELSLLRPLLNALKTDQIAATTATESYNENDYMYPRVQTLESDTTQVGDESQYGDTASSGSRSTQKDDEATGQGERATKDGTSPA